MADIEKEERCISKKGMIGVKFLCVRSCVRSEESEMRVAQSIYVGKLRQVDLNHTFNLDQLKLIDSSNLY